MLITAFAVSAATLLSSFCSPEHAPDLMTASAAETEIFGIDVSKYQARIDWQAVADAGAKFAILRCCKIIRAYDDWEPDERFEEYYQGARNAGLAVGCYMFTDSASTDEFLDDVEYMLKFIKDKPFDLPVFLDLESASRQEHLSPKVFMPSLLTALERIEEAGHTAGVYASTAFFNGCIDREQLQEYGYAVWEANYFNTVNGLSSPAGHDLSDEATIWQYSGNGKLPGINPTVDCNICYRSSYFSRSAAITNSELPAGALKQGDHFELAGTVSSQAVIRSITGEIFAADQPDTPLQTVTVNPCAREYKLTGFFTNRLDFSQLGNGDYTLRITAVDSSDTRLTVSESQFTVTPDGVPLATEPAPILTDTESSNPLLAPQTTTSTSIVRKEHPHTEQPHGLKRWWLGLIAWIYRHLPCRALFSWCTSMTFRLSLERTPLHRIFKRLSTTLEVSYLAANIGGNL